MNRYVAFALALAFIGLEIGIVAHILAEFGSFGDWFSYVIDLFDCPVWLSVTCMIGSLALAPLSAIAVILARR